MTDREIIKTELGRLKTELIEEGENTMFEQGRISAFEDMEVFIDSLQEEPVISIWHDVSEEPEDMSHCLIFYGDKESIGHYLHYEAVLYNKKEKMFVTSPCPHPTGYKVEQKSIDGGCVAEVYKDKRDRISLSDITKWCLLSDLLKLDNSCNFGKDLQEEPISIDFEKELYKAFGHVKDFTLGMRIAKWFYDMGKNRQKPVSEELEEAAKNHAAERFRVTRDRELAEKCKWSFKAGAEWQKKQMIERES